MQSLNHILIQPVPPHSLCPEVHRLNSVYFRRAGIRSRASRDSPPFHHRQRNKVSKLSYRYARTRSDGWHSSRQAGGASREELAPQWNSIEPFPATVGLRWTRCGLCNSFDLFPKFPPCPGFRERTYILERCGSEIWRVLLLLALDYQNVGPVGYHRSQNSS